MISISLEKYGPILSDNETGTQVYQEIKNSLVKDNTVSIDLTTVKSMATFCAKQIFGKLYLDLGASAFFSRIHLIGASEDLKTIIQVGIKSALDDNK